MEDENGGLSTSKIDMPTIDQNDKQDGEYEDEKWEDLDKKRIGNNMVVLGNINRF